MPINNTGSVLLHDLTPSQLAAVLPDPDGYTVIDAAQKTAYCQGCFGCWLKTPGQCVIRDSLQNISAQMGSCREMMILSRCCYGGFSPAIKKVLDRSIAVSLPFFTYRSGRVHHPMRYREHPALKICFYGDITEPERRTAMQLAEAYRVNMDYSSVEVSFAEGPEQIAGVINR